MTAMTPKPESPLAQEIAEMIKMAAHGQGLDILELTAIISERLAPLERERDELRDMVKEQARAWLHENAAKETVIEQLEDLSLAVEELLKVSIQVAEGIESWVHSKGKDLPNRGDWNHWPKELRAAAEHAHSLVVK